MEHVGSITIDTDRLVLRRAELTDASDMWKNWVNDPEVSRFLSWSPHKTIDFTVQRITECLERYKSPAEYKWLIVLKSIDEPIGSIDVRIRNESLGIVSVGYCIGRRWWHQGYTSESLIAVIGMMFDIVKANRIEAQHDPRNPHSGGVMLKCGMQREGLLRQNFLNNMGVSDSMIYSILRSEWKN